MDLAGNSVTQNLNVRRQHRSRRWSACVWRRRILSGTPHQHDQHRPANSCLNVYAKDLRPNAKGVFAAYVDVTYDPNLVSVADTNI